MGRDLISTGQLPNTALLAETEDLAERMVDGLHAFLDRELAAAETIAESNVGSKPSKDGVTARRERFAKILGVVDARLPITALELVSSTAASSRAAETAKFSVDRIRWPVLDGVEGEGLLLRPKTTPIATIIAIPDADWSPEMLVGLAPGVAPSAQFARHFADLGCLVLVPVLIDRANDWSGNPALRMTTQPHREFIWRMAFELGRHIVGYEIQKILALVDYLAAPHDGASAPVGVFGYGEGGLLALYSGALDTRIAATGVSGYFHSCRNVWHEPIYRDVWGLLRGFSDAEVASLVSPRPLLVEASPGPEVSGPPSPREGYYFTAASGTLGPTPLKEIKAEVARARRAYEANGATQSLDLVVPNDIEQGPGTSTALARFLQYLVGDYGRFVVASTGGWLTRLPRFLTDKRVVDPVALSSMPEINHVGPFDPLPRLHRQFDQLCRFTQRLLQNATVQREQFWGGAEPQSIEDWDQQCGPFRQHLWRELVGRCPDPTLPANPRTRLVYDEPTWTGYEVVLDVWPDVFTHGLILIPKDVQPEERRPVVVCQHGLESNVREVLDRDSPMYHGIAARLVEHGYVVYAPQNPYVGGERFRLLQRKAHPLKWSLYSLMVGQHQQTLAWLSQQPFVDPRRIAFYGHSYGGKAAMRIPAILDGYCLSICSGDFNEWLVKCASTSVPFSYMFLAEYDMYEFDLGNTFNYAEMAGLIAPRPFMVERGRQDSVGRDEWVAFEYARVQRLYANLKIPDRTEIGYADGGHEIHWQMTLPFLDKHLGWRPHGAREADGKNEDYREYGQGC